MPYALQCPHCGHRTFAASGVCQVPFQGTIDCEEWECEAELEVDTVDRWDTTDEEVTCLACTGCGKAVNEEEARAAYAAGYADYEAHRPDPNQGTLFADARDTNRPAGQEVPR